MRAQVRDWLAERRELVIGEDGDPDPLTIVYRPATFNAEYQKAVRELINEENSEHKVAVYTICTAVSSWDLKGPLTAREPVLDSKGKPITDAYKVPRFQERVIVPADQIIPIDSDHVRYVPNVLLFYIMQKINEDMSPDPKSPSS
jgi:hypothetical protein